MLPSAASLTLELAIRRGKIFTIDLLRAQLGLSNITGLFFRFIEIREP